ncbi:3-oxoacyl-[acyl-carrier-protein] synthase III C-terminal domain-containing protein [Streptomyces lydicus]|uniref:3-oxoacyl-[acyl-carrier-protein] synthase III C-terminal domain-containing protein n=1 Tax=Streptomyces lydicus TaxID=47763 RepID=UPI0035BE7CBC
MPSARRTRAVRARSPGDLCPGGPPRGEAGPRPRRRDHHAGAWPWPNRWPHRRQAATAAGWGLADVDRLAPHQANSRITAFVTRQLGVPDDRQLSNVCEVGNTGAASIPLLLAQSAADGRLKPGHRTLLTAFGAVLTWGATTLTWPDLSYPPSGRSRT